MHILQEPPVRIAPVQSGLMERGAIINTALPAGVSVPEAEPAPKRIRKPKAAAPAPAPAPLPEAKPKTVKKKAAPKAEAPAAPAPAPAPAATPAAKPARKARFEKGSQEAKDYMAALRAKAKGKAAAEAKAAETPGHSEADDAPVVAKTRGRKAAK